MFNTTRGLLKFVLLDIITFGIYGLIVGAHISEEINFIASKRDGLHTMNYLLIALIFSWLTLGVAPFVWYHRISNRIGSELVARGLPYQLSASDFWIWCVLGSLIVVGPFIYVHMLLKSMNLINADFIKSRQ